MGRVESIGSHAGGPKVLEDIGKEQNIGLEVQVGVFTQCGNVEFLKQRAQYL